MCPYAVAAPPIDVLFFQITNTFQTSQFSSQNLLQNFKEAFASGHKFTGIIQNNLLVFARHQFFLIQEFAQSNFVPCLLIKSKSS